MASMRILQIVATLVLFTAAMAVVAWVAKLAVPPFVDWALLKFGPYWVSAVFVAVWLPGAFYAYRAEMAARSGRSDRSF